MAGVKIVERLSATGGDDVVRGSGRDPPHDPVKGTLTDPR